MPEQNKNKEQSVLSRTASAAGAAKGALKVGKAIAGAAKGAAAGPYGMLAAGLWENRKAVGKVLAAIGALLLIPVLFILMLPSLRLSENPQFLAILGTKNARFFGHYLSVYSYLTSKTE